ncbi:MAG: LysR family transcriptional regulator [Myxococcaceae bacterium]|nr:LysR family transcriptional regulator [Myxococcaceae bacterium]
MELTDLRYFASVAFAGSFSRGARQSFVTTPAVSKAVQRLEAELSVRLFERTTRSVTMTPAGRELLERAQRIFAELESFKAEVEGREERLGGELRVAANEVLSIELLPLALAGLLRAHPGLNVAAHEMLPEAMGAALREGRIEVGLTIGGRTSAGIASHELGRSQGVLVCGRTHPLHGRPRVSARDLAEHVCVVPRFLGLEHLPSLDQFPDQRWPRRVGVTIELMQMAIRLAEEGVGLGYFPEISVRAQLDDGRLWSLEGLPAREPFVLRALTREAVRMRPAVRALLAQLTMLVRAAGRPRRTSPRTSRRR